MIFIEGYSCGPGVIAYRATDRRTGVTTERRANPLEHAPERFAENREILLRQLSAKVAEHRRAHVAATPIIAEAPAPEKPHPIIGVLGSKAFEKGDRVRPSTVAIVCNVFRGEHRFRQGVVKNLTRANAETVEILWDGLSVGQRFHRDFVELVK